MAPIDLRSHGARLNGLIYRAAGQGPHPVAVFLLGFPGNEKNLDLAQAVRRAGWSAIYVEYRGAWGSGGTFSLANSLEDVAAALAWIREPENAAAHHLDPDRLAIIGHSFGGWLALQSAPQQPATVCVAVMASWNVGWLSQHRLDHPDAWKDLAADIQDATDSAGGPLRASAEALLQEVAAAPTGWDYLSVAGGFRHRPPLLIAATRDSVDENAGMHDRLAKAVRAAGGHRARSLTLEDDHAFSASRVKLGEFLANWLEQECISGQGGGRTPRP
jgi:pimeloyl-ACP methyl ester carboxylesterase